MPRKRIHEPLNPAQKSTVHMLGWNGLWDGKKVQPKVEVTVAVDTCRFALDENGKAKLVDGDAAKAKPALDLLHHAGLA